MHRTSIIHIFLIITIAGLLSDTVFAYDNEIDYSAPYLTVDPETGDIVQNFTLNTPIGDIAVAVGEIAVLGSVVY